MFGPRVQVGDGHLHGLNLLMFGGDGAELIADLVTLHWDVLALDVRDVDKDVAASIRWRDEAVAFGAGEIFTHASKQRTLRRPSRR